MDIILIDSSILYKTSSWYFLSLIPQGALLFTYLLHSLINLNISFKASVISHLSKREDILDKSNFLLKSSSTLDLLILPLKFFSTRETLLETRFPSSLASSLFILLINAFSLKSPSSPNGISLTKKYLNGSTPYFPINAKGSI